MVKQKYMLRRQSGKRDNFESFFCLERRTVTMGLVVTLYVESGYITTLQLQFHVEWVLNPVTTVKQIKRYKLCQNISSQVPAPHTCNIGHWLDLHSEN